MKKILSIVLAMAVMLSTVVISGTAFAEESTEKIYTMVSGRLNIKTGVETIPSNFLDKDDVNNVISITMPDTVTDIGSRAFKNCANLSYVKLSKNITQINDSTFYGCSRLTDITIPAKVECIDKYAFYGCTNLSNMNFESNTTLTQILSYAFYNCISLSNFSIPDSVTTLGTYAFYNCSSLTNITIPNSVSVVPEKCFYGCINATDLKLSKTLTEIGNNAFENCKTIKSINMPNTVEKVGVAAFNGCKNVRNIHISTNLGSLSKSVFKSCSSLTSLTIPNNIYVINSNAFTDCKSLLNIIVPENVYILDNEAFKGCTNLKTCQLPTKLTSIPSGLFSGCTSLEAITIPKTVKSISASAFYNCQSLKNIDIPDTVKTIGSSAFSGCKNIETLKLSNNCETIGANAFYNCSKIQNVELPETVNTIGESAFAYCSSLSDVTVKSNLDAIGNNAFSKINRNCVFHCYSNGYSFNYFKSLGYNVECINHDKGSYQVIKATPKTNGSYGIKCNACGAILEDNKVILRPSSIHLSTNSTPYTGNEIKPDVTVYDAKGNAISKSNYEVVYNNNVHPGNATVTVNFKGKYYEGSMTSEFIIRTTANINNPIYDWDNATVVDFSKSKTYKYTITNDNSLSYFKINSADAGYYEVRISGYYPATPDYSCSMFINNTPFANNASYITNNGIINVNSANSNGVLKSIMRLEQGNNYGVINVQYAANKNAGKTITVSFTKHTSHSTVENIIPASTSTNGAIVKKCKVCGETILTTVIPRIRNVSLTKTKFVYNGNSRTPYVTVYNTNGNKISSGYYDVTYKNNKNVGKGTVIITLKGNYSGTITKTFKIVPASINISRLSVKGKTVTVKWKKQKKQVTGYQIRYSTKSNMKSSKTITISKKSTSSKKISKLKKKKKYYIQIRTYKKVGKTKYYSNWSKKGVAKIGKK